MDNFKNNTPRKLKICYNSFHNKTINQATGFQLKNFNKF